MADTDHLNGNLVVYFRFIGVLDQNPVGPFPGREKPFALVPHVDEPAAVHGVDYSSLDDLSPLDFLAVAVQFQHAFHGLRLVRFNLSPGRIFSGGNAVLFLRFHIRHIHVFRLLFLCCCGFLRLKLVISRFFRHNLPSPLTPAMSLLRLSVHL